MLQIGVSADLWISMAQPCTALSTGRAECEADFAWGIQFRAADEP